MCSLWVFSITSSSFMNLFCASSWQMASLTEKCYTLHTYAICFSLTVLSPLFSKRKLLSLLNSIGFSIRSVAYNPHKNYANWQIVFLLQQFEHLFQASGCLIAFCLYQCKSWRDQSPLRVQVQLQVFEIVMEPFQHLSVGYCCTIEIIFTFN